jgi:hypothetical protein
MASWWFRCAEEKAFHRTRDAAGSHLRNGSAVCAELFRPIDSLPAESARALPDVVCVSLSVRSFRGNAEQTARDPEALARMLQAELARVGCNPGAVDGRWGAKAIEALRQFSRHAKMSLSVDEPTEDALRAIAAIKRPVCILKCAAHQKVSGGRCVSVAKSEPPAAKAEGSGKLCWPGYAPWGPRACTGDPRERPVN